MVSAKKKGLNGKQHMQNKDAAKVYMKENNKSAIKLSQNDL